MKKTLILAVILAILLSFIGKENLKSAEGEWVLLTNNPGIGVKITDIVVDPNNSEIIYVAGDNGVWKSSDGGKKWNQVVTGISVTCIIMDSKNSNVIFAGTYGSIFKTTDGGRNWTQLLLDKSPNNSFCSLPVNSIAFDSLNNKLYAGTYNSIWRSRDGGENWVRLSYFAEREVGPVVIDPEDSSAVYAGSGRLYYTSDGGDSWQGISSDPVSGITKIVLSPKNSSIIYVAGKNDIYVSADRGNTWMQAGLTDHSLLTTLPINDIAIDPQNTLNIYAALSWGFFDVNEKWNGVIKSANGGASWKTINTGLPKAIPGSEQVSVDVIGVDPKNPQTLYAGISGRGIYKFIQGIPYTKIVLRVGASTFTVDGFSHTLDYPPVIINGRTLLPIRAVIESMGGIVQWNNSERKVTINLDKNTVELWIGKNTANVNGVTKQIDSTNPQVAPMLISGRTMLPLRFIAENLGCDVQWDGKTQTITIIYNH
jgi:photosystem II stability/assembly factor-like uncharacterized protein